MEIDVKEDEYSVGEYRYLEWWEVFHQVAFWKRV